MRPEFTDNLKNALEQAQTAARGLNQDFVGVEHLLLGLLACEGCAVSRALARNEVSAIELRDKLMRTLPRGKQPPVVTGQLPLSPAARHAINAALVDAQNRRENQVSTPGVLLALLDEPDSGIQQALRDCGADLDQLKRLVRDDVSHSSEQPER